MMKKAVGVAPKTWNNWLVDAVLFIGGVVAAVTGIYFLFLPIGGYQGGRNPMYGITILFERHTWEDFHIWFGIAMIAAALIHIVLHWSWIVSMARRVWEALTQHEQRFTRRTRENFLINLAVALGFLVTAVSGLYLFVIPGGRYGVTDPGFLFTRTTWDLIHTWSGIVMVSAAAVHFAIHWRWVTKVTGKMSKAILNRFSVKPAQQQVETTDF